MSIRRLLDSWDRPGQPISSLAEWWLVAADQLLRPVALLAVIAAASRYLLS